MTCECATTPSLHQPANNTVLKIEFLYLDVETCQPCGGTSEALAEAMASLTAPLAAMGITMQLIKIHVKTAELARQHTFLASPTIKIAGKDIDPAVTQDDCPSCGNLAGDGIAVDCRTWRWNDTVFHAAPIGKIVSEIMSAAIAMVAANENCCADNGCTDNETELDQAYTLPENLSRFFAARANNQPLGC